MRVAIAALSLLLFATACSGDPEPEPTETPVVEATTEEATEEPTEEPTVEPTATPVPAYPLTGEPIADDVLDDRPVVAVKIDNDPDARPQVGLSDADIVFVEPIEGLTRLVAIFHSRGEGEVGPVRSGRRVDPKLFGSFQPIFTFSGAAGPNYADIDAGFPNTVVNDRDQSGWRREGSRPAPHNLFIPLETIREKRPDAPAAAEEAAFSFDADAPEGGTELDGFTVDYGRFDTNSEWVWDADENGWARSQNGTPHRSGVPDQAVNRDPDAEEQPVQIVAANVVVLTVETTGSQVEPITVTGEGPVVIHRDGQAFEGTWRKTGDADHYEFRDATGELIPLAPGQTWIEVMPASGTYTIGTPATE